MNISTIYGYAKNFALPVALHFSSAPELCKKASWLPPIAISIYNLSRSDTFQQIKTNFSSIDQKFKITELSKQLLAIGAPIALGFTSSPDWLKKTAWCAPIALNAYHSAPENLKTTIGAISEIVASSCKSTITGVSSALKVCGDTLADEKHREKILYGLLSIAGTAISLWATKDRSDYFKFTAMLITHTSLFAAFNKERKDLGVGLFFLV